MLIDEAYIKVKAGNGGDGLVHFYHDRIRPKGGPDGGKGGSGGSVFFEAVSDISKLHQFRHGKEFLAQNGAPGGSNQKSGKDGEDLVLQVPVGTVVNYDNGTSIELSKIGEKVMITKGGRGGYGNYHFRSATNQTPEDFVPGQKRPFRNLFLQLKLIANVGLIGLPNAGKTSLLNEMTSANSKVADYPFTTLEPNLGVTKSGLVLADIPGLIEGASDGKGLGTKFLKHIERTSILVHCLSCESTDLKRDYQVVRRELEGYSSKLAEKPEIIILTKSDLIDNPKTLQTLQKSLKANLSVSIIDDKSLKNLNDLLTKTVTPMLS
jgi:GTPase